MNREIEPKKTYTSTLLTQFLAIAYRVEVLFLAIVYCIAFYKQLIGISPKKEDQELTEEQASPYWNKPQIMYPMQTDL